MTIIAVSRALILSVNTDLRMLLDPVVWWCRGREGLTPGFPFKNLLSNSFGVNMGCKDQKGKELVSYRSWKPAVGGLFELLLYLNIT